MSVFLGSSPRSPTKTMDYSMYLQKPIDDVESFFIIVNVARSKKSKTYPRVRGKFTLQKQNTVDFSRYLDLRARRRRDEYPLADLEVNEFFDLHNKYEFNHNIFFFVFDIKRDSHSRIDCIATSQESGQKIDGLYWQHEIYQNMMKDKKQLRSLRENELRRLFEKEWFWQEILSEYVFAILKL